MAPAFSSSAQIPRPSVDRGVSRDTQRNSWPGRGLPLREALRPAEVLSHLGAWSSTRHSRRIFLMPFSVRERAVCSWFSERSGRARAEFTDSAAFHDKHSDNLAACDSWLCV